MRSLSMPACYACLSEAEQREVYGGGEFRTAWDSFTANLHFGDFVFGGGLLSFSVSFVPMLLFNVVRIGFRMAGSLYRKAGELFGYQDETLTALQTYSDDMRARRSMRS